MPITRVSAESTIMPWHGDTGLSSQQPQPLISQLGPPPGTSCCLLVQPAVTVTEWHSAATGIVSCRIGACYGATAIMAR